MKRIAIVLALIALSVSLTATNAEAKKPRKLSIGAYISGAKIAYGLSGGDETPRPRYALVLLDSCLLWHGMVPEAYFWQVTIYSDLVREIPRSDLSARREGLGRMLVALDSLKLSCDKENEEVKKKRKKKCPSYLITADSVRDEWYAEYFNNGQEARAEVRDDLQPALSEATDADEKADLQKEIEEQQESSIANYGMAEFLKPDDASVLINLAELLANMGSFVDALPYQLRAAELSKENDPEYYSIMMQQVGFSHYELEDYQSAATVFSELADELTGDEAQEVRKSLYRNTVAAYSSLQLLDSVIYYNHKVLQMDPGDANALATLGGMWFNKIQELNLQRSDARKAKDSELQESIGSQLKETGDSAIYYLQLAFEADSTDEQSIELYSIANTLNGNVEQAVVGWEMLALANPEEKRFWIYIGDNYITLSRFDEAIAPYEKASELDPTNIKVLDNLVNLYNNSGAKAKAKTAQAKLDKLK